MANIVSTSHGKRDGQISPELRQRLERATEKRRRKQKLSACLKKKGLPTLDLRDGRAEAFIRSEIGRALNQMLDELPVGLAVALERRLVPDLRFKSRQLNRALRAARLGYRRDKLRFKLDERGTGDRSVQPAYWGQQCSQSGSTLSMNCRSQQSPMCLWCGHTANADENAASTIAQRFSDEELNSLPFREVEAALALRFMCRLPDARRASAGLDTSPAASGGESYKRSTLALRAGASVSPVQTPV